MSNDQLRDHKAGMSVIGDFAEWAETHIANYDFQHAVHPDFPEPFVMADMPSAFVVAMATNGDGSCWHVPGRWKAQEGDGREWLCVRLPSLQRD